MNISRRRALNFLPKASRIAIAAVPRDTLNAIIESPDTKIAWVRLFLLPFLCLQAPLKVAKSHKQTFATQLNNRITIFIQNRELVDMIPLPKLKWSPNRQTDVQQLMIRVSEKLDKGD